MSYEDVLTSINISLAFIALDAVISKLDKCKQSYQYLATYAQQYSPTSLSRHSQHTYSPNTNGPTALSLQSKGGLHKEVFEVGRLTGRLCEAGRRFTQWPTSWSHFPPHGLRQSARHDN